MKPSIGRIVHYIGDRGVHMAAIITEVQSSTVALHLFPPPLAGPYYAPSYDTAAVPFDDGHSLGTWHWPEREQ